MTKEEMVEILRKLLDTDSSLDFLLQLREEDLRTLVACVRVRMDQG